MDEWQWRLVQTKDDAEAYLCILQHDAEVLGKTEYPNVDVEGILTVAQDKGRGYRYWIGESDKSGAMVCYLIRVLPTDQGSPERNRPTVVQIGAMPGSDGVGWERVYARAVEVVYQHIQATASELMAQSHWKDGRLRVVGIDQKRGRLLAAEIAKLSDVRDAGGAVHRFSLEVCRGQ